MLDTIARLKELEADVRYQEPPSPTEPEWGYVPGYLPILLSAPHGAAHVRAGKPKEEDEFTAALARLVAERSGAHVLYARRKSMKDPNWHLDAPYKTFFSAKIVQKANIQFVLDFHGRSATPILAFGTGDQYVGRSLFWQIRCNCCNVGRVWFYPEAKV